MPGQIDTILQSFLSRVKGKDNLLLFSALREFCEQDESFLILLRQLVAKNINLVINTIPGLAVFIAGKKIINLHPDLLIMLQNANAGKLELDAKSTLKLMITHEATHAAHIPQY
mgnify:CR=1 FL=1